MDGGRGRRGPLVETRSAAGSHPASRRRPGCAAPSSYRGEGVHPARRDGARGGSTGRAHGPRLPRSHRPPALGGERPVPPPKRTGRGPRQPGAGARGVSRGGRPRWEPSRRENSPGRAGHPGGDRGAFRQRPRSGGCTRMGPRHTCGHIAAANPPRRPHPEGCPPGSARSGPCEGSAAETYPGRRGLVFCPGTRPAGDCRRGSISFTGSTRHGRTRQTGPSRRHWPNGSRRISTVSAGPASWLGSISPASSWTGSAGSCGLVSRRAPRHMSGFPPDHGSPSITVTPTLRSSRSGCRNCLVFRRLHVSLLGGFPSPCTSFRRRDDRSR